MKKYAYVSLFLISYLFYGFLLSQFDVSVVSTSIKPDHPFPFFDYRGAIHIHSNISQGSGNYQQIVAAAKNVGLDFAIITDLNPVFEPMEREGYDQNLLLLIGSKYSYLDSRILHYSENKGYIGHSLGDVQVHFADFFSQNDPPVKLNTSVLAHPLRQGFKWIGEYPANLAAIEVLNLKSIQQKEWEQSKASSLWSLLIYPFNSQLSFLRLFREPSQELNLWEELGQKNKKMVGHLGLEATSKAIPYTGLSINFPGYEKIFELASTHLLLGSELTGNAPKDRAKVLQALRDGQFYMSIDILGNPKGFVSYIQDGDKIIPMGGSVNFKKNLKLHVRLPAQPRVPFETQVYLNGKIVALLKDVENVYPISEPGRYRLTVRVLPTLPLPDAKKWIPWIYTNHFQVRESSP